MSSDKLSVEMMPNNTAVSRSPAESNRAIQDKINRYMNWVNAFAADLDVAREDDADPENLSYYYELALNNCGLDVSDEIKQTYISTICSFNRPEFASWVASILSDLNSCKSVANSANRFPGESVLVLVYIAKHYQLNVLSMRNLIRTVFDFLCYYEETQYCPNGKFNVVSSTHNILTTLLWAFPVEYRIGILRKINME